MYFAGAPVNKHSAQALDSRVFNLVYLATDVFEEKQRFHLDSLAWLSAGWRKHSSVASLDFTNE